MKGRLLLILFFCIPYLKGLNQEYNYYHYDVKDGLSGLTVYSIEQDKDGFLWFGTDAGLSRYDGSHFKNYAINEGLATNDIINLFVDSKNRVWIFPFKSSICYYYQGKIYNANNDTLLRKFKLRDEIFKAREDSAGNIFFIEQKKIHVLTAENDVKEITKIDNREFDINSCGIDSDGFCNIYVSVKYGNETDLRFRIYRYQNSGLVLRNIILDSSFTRNSIEVNPKYSIIKNANVFVLHVNNKSFKIEVPNHFHTVSYLTDSTFAISTFDKTYLYNITAKKKVDSFLINKTVNRCFKDREDNLWFATATEGIYFLPLNKIRVYRFEDNSSFLPVYALHEFNGELYIGNSKNHLWKLNLKKNYLEKISISDRYVINQISQIESLKDGSIYVASNIGLIKLANNNTSVYLQDLSVKKFIIHDSSIVVATSRAVFDFSRYNYNLHNIIWNSRATCVDKINNNYYVGTLKSLYLVSSDSVHIVTDLGKDFQGLRDKIISINTVTGNDAWVVTESNGLVYIKNDKVLYQFNSQNGLPGNLCRCVYIAHNSLWVGTDRGVCKIDISHRPFLVQNLLFPEEVSPDFINCIYVTGDSVFAGTSSGLSLITDTATKQKSICSLKLLGITSKQANWYFKQDSIHLSSDDNFLHFEYAGISFTSGGDITYYYKLKGLGDGWQSTKQNILEFQSLYPGKYELNIYAVNRYGVKSKTLTVAFTKEKPFWQLLWVQGIFLIVLVILGWLIVKARIKAVREKAHENLLRERKVNELEQMALRAQMNPHFIFNSLNSIQQYIFSGSVIEANEFITSFSSLVRQTLYMSGKKFIALADEVKYLESYLTLEQSKYEHRFNFQIVLEDDIAEIQVPPLIVQPFVENSIRHGVLNLKSGPGKILVHFFGESDFLFCIVEDNGIGRKNAMRLQKLTQFSHQSKGMELVQNRIENLNSIYNCDIMVSVEDINEKTATGTRVKIKLPLNYDEQTN